MDMGSNFCMVCSSSDSIPASGAFLNTFFFAGFAYNIRMQFELSSALVDDILFHMEDQHGEYRLDTREGLVVPVGDPEADMDDDDDADDGDRYVSLPEWGPADGFRLMERFAAGLRNALVRGELSAALDRGRGVFRAFKDTLGRYPETEKLWFAYKDGEMKREVLAWYNALRESRGLELIGEEPEDIAGLALEDFRFREGTPGDLGPASQLHRACIEECGNSPDGGGSNDDVLSGMGDWVFPGEISFVVETVGGDFAGYASGVRSGDTCLRVCAVEVHGEYRGLGLGKSLVARLLEYADGRKIPQVTVDLPAGQEYFSRVLLREFFKPGVQRYVRNTGLGTP